MSVALCFSGSPSSGYHIRLLATRTLSCPEKRFLRLAQRVMIHSTRRVLPARGKPPPSEQASGAGVIAVMTFMIWLLPPWTVPYLPATFYFGPAPACNDNACH